jgi:hypothetical protein
VEAAVGGEGATAVIVHVSGRHPGDAEVRTIVVGLLTAFPGFADDDYTDHLWTLDDLKNERHVQNHPFFDYLGWHEEWYGRPQA